MKISQTVRKISGMLALVIVFGLSLMGFSSSSASAADVPDYRLQISPVRLDVEKLEPGTTYTDVFKVQNTGAKAYAFTTGVTPYSVSNTEDGEYRPNYESETSYTDIANWITLSAYEGYVEPGSQQEITVTINVPSDVPAGGQYAMIYAQLDSDETSAKNEEHDSDAGASFSIEQRVGLIVYADVDGETRKEAEILDLNIPTFMFQPPVSSTSLVKNDGNIHANVEYTLQVFPLFSDEEVYTNEENPTILTVLPETRRFNTISWEGSPQLGLFRVRATVKIFDETKELEKLVFICPIWFLFVILLIIFCALFWLITRMRGRKQQRNN